MMLAYICLLGLCFGSFVNAFVWRIRKKKNWTSERSVCVRCGHVLAPQDLIPVLSWIFLRGRFRYCKKLISVQYPLVELVGSLSFGLSYIYWPHALNEAADYIFFGAWLLVLIGLLALAIYDLRWMLLPNKILFPLIYVQTVVIIAGWVIGGSMVPSLPSAVAGIACSFGLFYVLFQVSKGKWIGGGDVKLGILIGLLVGGPFPALLVLFLASLFGTIVTLPLLMSGKKELTGKISFGPYLIGALFVVYLFGQSIIDWYAGYFLGL
jgi:prepilin signal peptidase PulO-like enzyme (type II secretory pathway)